MLVRWPICFALGYISFLERMENHLIWRLNKVSAKSESLINAIVFLPSYSLFGLFMGFLIKRVELPI